MHFHLQIDWHTSKGSTGLNSHMFIFCGASAFSVLWTEHQVFFLDFYKEHWLLFCGTHSDVGASSSLFPVLQLIWRRFFESLMLARTSQLFSFGSSFSCFYSNWHCDFVFHYLTKTFSVPAKFLNDGLVLIEYQGLWWPAACAVCSVLCSLRPVWVLCVCGTYADQPSEINVSSALPVSTSSQHRTFVLCS